MRRGVSMIEFLVAALITTILMAFFVPIFSDLFAANNFAMFSPAVQDRSTAMVSLIARDLRRAPIIGGAAITAATSKSITIYSDTAGDTATYALSGTTCQLTIGGQVTTIATGAILNIVYFQSSSYNATGLSAFVPQNLSDYQKVVAVKIAGKVSNNGYSGTYTTMVKLRDCPSKSIAF